MGVQEYRSTGVSTGDMSAGLREYGREGSFKSSAAPYFSSDSSNKTDLFRQVRS